MSVETIFAGTEDVYTTSEGVCTHCSYSQKHTLCDASEIDRSSDSYYALLETITYPYEENKQNSEEIMLYEIKYKIYTLGRVYGRFYNEDNDRAEIPLHALISTEDGITVNELKYVVHVFF